MVDPVMAQDGHSYERTEVCHRFEVLDPSFPLPSVGSFGPLGPGGLFESRHDQASVAGLTVARLIGQPPHSVADPSMWDVWVVLLFMNDIPGLTCHM